MPSAKKFKRKSDFVFKPHIAALFQVHGLTPAEMDTVGYLMEGYSNQEIADLMCVALVTVKFHTNKLYKTFGVPDRSNFIILMARRGYFADAVEGLLQPAAARRSAQTVNVTGTAQLIKGTQNV